jgi:hypothetical protein
MVFAGSEQFLRQSMAQESSIEKPRPKEEQRRIELTVAIG